MTAAEVLKSRHTLDDFIHSICGYDLDNCSGGVYREVCLAYYEKGILLSSYHNNRSECGVYAATIPTSTIRSGCQDCWSKIGSPYPSVTEGELVSVWQDGKWIKEGLWITTSLEVIAKLLAKMEQIKTKNAAEG